MMADESPEESNDYETPPAFFPQDEESLIDEHPGDYGEPVEVQVEAVFMTQSGAEIQHFVVLSDGERKMPIFIGEFEAAAITVALDGKKMDRPGSHDLFKNILDKLEATIDRIVIDDLWGSTYYAKIYLDQDGEESEIDSRPSDAIALAVRFGAQILVLDGIMDQASS